MNYEMWFPPAGFRRGLINVLDVRRRFSQGEMDYLYDNGINPVRFYPGRGIVIWGQKTLLARPSHLDRLNVRLLLIVIEPAIRMALEDFIMEINDDPARAIVRALLVSNMDDIKARRGVYDYMVKCDDENNTPEEIDNHILNVWLFVKPTMSIEYIPFKVVITRTGMDFSIAAQQLNANI
jgi:phage tail sheath protein FI